MIKVLELSKEVKKSQKIMIMEFFIVIKVLKHIKSSYFPDLKPHRYLSSWENGVYNIMEDEFYPYDDVVNFFQLKIFKSFFKRILIQKEFKKLKKMSQMNLWKILCKI